MNDVERTVFLVGRVLAGFFYLIMGMGHFGRYPEMTAGVSEMGLPAPGLAVVITGFLLVIAGILILIGYHPLLGVLSAALFLVPVTLVMHAFWNIEDPVARQQEVATFLRNVGLLGATLMFVAIPRPWPTSVEQMLQRRERKDKFSDEEFDDVEFVNEEVETTDYDDGATL